MVNAPLTAEKVSFGDELWRPGMVWMRAGKNSGIWKALAAAMGLHALVLLLPMTQSPVPGNDDAGIELELITLLPKSNLGVEVQAVTTPEPPLERPIAHNNTPSPIEPLAPPPGPAPNAAEKRPPVLLVKRTAADPTNIILSRQFITEQSVAERLFGKPLAIDPPATRKEFHFPDRTNMLTMLSRPMQGLPFDYTPGLVHFAYDPGVRGDLQRFWDVITPEFGWRTNNGTEFRCVWVLVVVGCGWK